MAPSTTRNRKERRAAAKTEGKTADIDRLMIAAIAAHRAGRLDQAEPLYRRVGDLAPSLPEAQINLGVVLQGLGRPDEAAAILARAAERWPGLAAAPANLGAALIAAGRPDQACAACRRARQLDPGAVGNLVNLALAEQSLGHPQAAAEACRTALAVQPHLHSGLAGLGLALRHLGQSEPAAAALSRALALAPADADGWLNLGNLRAGQPALAAALYRTALALRPGHAPTWSNLGVALRQPDPDGALGALRRALVLAPDWAQSRANLGATLLATGRYGEALAACRQAVALAPALAEAVNNAANALMGLERPGPALALYRRAQVLDPTYPEAHANQGTALVQLGRAAEALADYDAALARRPDYAEARLQRAMALLSLGRLGEGWAAFEGRRATGRYRARHRAYSEPDWRGQRLDGRAILLHAEQGLGDTLQFVRFAPLVAERGGRVLLCVPPTLVRLLAEIPGVAAVAGDPAALPAWDCQLPLMSLPHALGLAGIPPGAPYLRAEPRATAEWAGRLAALAGRKVGLVWSGDPRRHDPEASLIDRRRSLRLDRLAPLASLDGLSLVSLQMGAPAAEAAGLALFDAMARIGDFADTAALVANLDLVVTVDTSVAHLAGAMGKPVWILSRFDACWRWGQDREDSPWYPSARLFRQTTAGDWDGVVARLTRALRDWLAGEQA